MAPYDMQIGLGIGAILGIGIGMLIIIVIGEGNLNVKQRINKKVKLNEAKVVDKATLEDLADRTKDGKPVAFCRCWKSKTFPYCDGSHASWNTEAKDNTGPLLVVGK
mmetsp:Transcript_43472/g.98254  ORF Transcript_43472/g.98254 Transcript_43472/m.98254 type:complete len:107 (-) Transcript_43472:287-607(-)|eukprot:CAMPEP_0172614896 /NCGR_PEP_ID=MMETSP1068-20121228/55693_1 /TAXON_ID=35684 /ORGANISM="Pseudopedinella elastica, Strain CCMP716" /LENGTH=106 /DNA_ID=CAMNT_0013419849 /DNA_START=57 /DNA_END=377 /DNA_ORIENTATION=-